jgi:hypothetical protein
MSVLDSETSNLSKITGRLRHLLDTIAYHSNNPDAQTRVVTPEEMTELLSWLMRAGQSLRPLSGDHTVPEQEIAEYRREVERLHALLPSIHAALLAERTRLEQERERVRTAGEWMQRSRETL